MTAADLVELLRLFQSAALTVWLDGGWGVDALLQKQTRAHQDVDIIPQVADVSKLIELLMRRGFAMTEGTPPHAFVLTDANGLKVDVHAVTFDDAGNGLHRMDNGGDWIFKPEAFTGQGMIADRPVRCLSPLAQVQCHAQGYPPTDKDLQDMAHLQQRFNVELPLILRRTAADPAHGFRRA